MKMKLNILHEPCRYLMFNNSTFLEQIHSHIKYEIFGYRNIKLIYHKF